MFVHVSAPRVYDELTLLVAALYDSVRFFLTQMCHFNKKTCKNFHYNYYSVALYQ